MYFFIIILHIIFYECDIKIHGSLQTERKRLRKKYWPPVLLYEPLLEKWGRLYRDSWYSSDKILYYQLSFFISFKNLLFKNYCIRKNDSVVIRDGHVDIFADHQSASNSKKKTDIRDVGSTADLVLLFLVLLVPTGTHWYPLVLVLVILVVLVVRKPAVFRKPAGREVMPLVRA